MVAENGRRGAPVLAPISALATLPAHTQRAAIVATVRRRPQSRAGMCDALGLSSSSVSRLVQSLLKQQIIIEQPAIAQGMGRPRVPLQVNPKTGCLLSLILTRHRIDSLLLDAAGGELARESHGVLEPDAKISTVIEQAHGVLARVRQRTKLLAVSVSAPGVVDATGRVSDAPDLGWKRGQNLGTELEAALGVPVAVLNDVNCMVLAERRFGCAAEVDNAVLIYLGRQGVGMGSVVDGRLQIGSAGASGEIGLMPVDLADNSRQPTNVEQMLSLDAVAEVLGASSTGDSELVELLLRQTAQHDPIAGAHFARMRTVMLRALGTIVLIQNPQLIVLGGVLRDLFAAEIDSLMRDLSAWVPSAPTLRNSRLGRDEIHWTLQGKCWETVLAGGI